MRTAIGWVFGVVLGLLAMGPAFAGVAESRDWFEAQSDEDRESIQYDLTLLGHFKFIIDRQFGQNTYQALLAYQRSQGLEETGVLSESERQTLFDQSDVVFDAMGLADTRDEAGRSSLVLPAALLTEVTPYDNGNQYATADGGITLQTMVEPQTMRSFADLFASFSPANEGMTITESSYNTSRFVVSGTQDGRAFYTMYENAGTESVGYSLSWTEAHAADAQIIKIFIASYFIPLKFLADPEVEKASAAPGDTFGAWSLPPESPDVIALNGEIGETLVTDFETALAARPNAKVLLLNSPGGYVDYALVVAHKVKDLGISTLVASGSGCYSACSYIFFAGASREVDGELGVHQISAEVADLVLAQTTLADVLGALNEFQVEQPIITVMLRTPPEEMYVFTSAQIAELGIDRGDDIEVATVAMPVDQPVNTPAAAGEPTKPMAGGTAYVMLSLRSDEADAARSLKYAKDTYAGAIGTAEPEVAVGEGARGPVYEVRVPASSVENANAICAAIKSAGGGCYVATAG